MLPQAPCYLGMAPPWACRLKAGLKGSDPWPTQRDASSASFDKVARFSAMALAWLMQKTTLGKKGPKVSRLGLGCMGMSDFYGPQNRDAAQSTATIHQALDLGLNLIDTADMYGPHTNEILVGKAIAGRRQEVVLATKFGNERTPDGAFVGINGRPSYVTQACEASLRRLKTDVIDIYYQHRVDPTVPIEETVGAMAALVQAGKVRYLGLSEASCATIRRAHKVHPITVVQSEYALWFREPEVELIATLRGLDIGFVPYGALGRGFLTGGLRTPKDLPPGDARATHPRFSAEHFAHNLGLVHIIEQVAHKMRVTPSQVALAWLLAQGNDIVPLFGTTQPSRVVQNAHAITLRMSPDMQDCLDQAFTLGVAQGDRYADMSTVNR
jgi:aryl-alcohol dehydrogenase-like predicted oxidoreductase